MWSGVVNSYSTSCLYSSHVVSLMYYCIRIPHALYNILQNWFYVSSTCAEHIPYMMHDFAELVWPLAAARTLVKLRARRAAVARTARV